MYRGKRHYELSNHLGNVQVVFSDKRVSVCDAELAVDYFEAEVLSAVDYYPFGMMMPDCQYYAGSDSSNYRFGFNGQEKDNEKAGLGNSIDFGARIYNCRLGIWLSIDPHARKYPYISNYTFAVNSPIQAVDINGKDHYYVIWKTKDGDPGHVALAVPKYEKVIENGVEVLKATGLVTIYGIGSDQSEEDYLKNPFEIVEGHFEAYTVSVDDLQKFVHGEQGYPDVIYMVNSTPEEDQIFHKLMEQFNPPKGSKTLAKKINYKLTANGFSERDENAYNCTSFITTAANQVYKHDFYAGEYVQLRSIPLIYEGKPIITPSFNAMVHTPGHLIGRSLITHNILNINILC